MKNGALKRALWGSQHHSNSGVLRTAKSAKFTRFTMFTMSNKLVITLTGRQLSCDNISGFFSKNSSVVRYLFLENNLFGVGPKLFF